MCACVYKHIYTYIHINMYVCIYTHIYTINNLLNLIHLPHFVSEPLYGTLITKLKSDFCWFVLFYCLSVFVRSALHVCLKASFGGVLRSV